MYVMTLTLVSGANQVVATSKTSGVPGFDPVAQFQSLVFYNPNASNAVYIGDSAVSSTNGIKLAAGSTLSVNGLLEYGEDLKSWYVAPTSASDKVTVMVIS